MGRCVGGVLGETVCRERGLQDGGFVGEVCRWWFRVYA